MRVPLSPYTASEFIPMVWRRFTGPSPRPPTLDKTVRLRDGAPDRWIGFVGDICPLFDRETSFGDGVTSFFRDCTDVVGNFEGVFSGRYWQPFLMKHTTDIFASLEEVRALDHWVLSVANNHATDFGRAGLQHTLRHLERQHIQWVGASGRSRIPLGGDVTVTAWTRWMNRPDGGVPRSNPGAPSAPGVHIAFPHWGYEHERQPRANQSAPNGYALTVGHHTHLPQPFEHDDEGLIAWSLGNFVTGKQLPVLGEGALLKVGLTYDATGPPNIAAAHFREIDLDRSRTHCHVRLRQPHRSNGTPDRQEPSPMRAS